MNETDEELLAELKMVSKENVCDPLLVIKVGAEGVQRSRDIIEMPVGPRAVEVEEYRLEGETYPSWPEWIRQLVPEGSCWLRLVWQDGSYSIRLDNHRGLTLAGHKFKDSKERLS